MSHPSGEVKTATLREEKYADKKMWAAGRKAGSILLIQGVYGAFPV